MYIHSEIFYSTSSSINLQSSEESIWSNHTCVIISMEQDVNPFLEEELQRKYRACADAEARCFYDSLSITQIMFNHEDNFWIDDFSLSNQDFNGWFLRTIIFQNNINQLQLFLFFSVFFFFLSLPVSCFQWREYWLHLLPME